MIALLTEHPPEIQTFRARPWPYQRTFKTPLKELTRFVSTFLSPFSFEKGLLSTHEVVFEPKRMLNLLDRNHVSIDDPYHLNIAVAGPLAIAQLLEAALGDWLNFLFISSPEVVAIYADHDEYTTFYGREDSVVKELASVLKGSGFESVLDYTRK